MRTLVAAAVGVAAAALPSALDDASVALLREGSPLWSALQAEEFARVGDAYGEPLAAGRPNWPVKEQGAVKPEVVDVDGLALGRFEVTRAQWRSFRPATEVAAGDENLPIHGVALADARAYVAWLSEATGERWRLPFVDELGPLIAAAPADENTLDAWAGFAPSAEDATKLVALAQQRVMARVTGMPVLLHEVGSSAPLVVGPATARVALHDVGGNVAEWAAVRDSKGDEARAIGGCALTVRAPGRTDPPPAAAIGLRIVRDSKEK